MPSSWEICVSADRIHWHRLQQMAEGQPWKNAEERHYTVTPTSGVTGIKLVVTATDNKSILRLYEFRPEFAVPSGPASEFKTLHDASTLQTDACTKEAEERVIPEFLYAYKDYNVVRAGELYVAAAQDLGPLDVASVLSNTAPLPPAAKFIVARDIVSLKVTVDTYAKEAKAGAPPQILYIYKGYNVIRSGELYVGAAQDLGTMDVGDVLAHTAPQPPPDKFIVANNSNDLEAAINEYVNEAHAAAPPELLYAYKGYNIVRVGELYVGVAQGARPHGRRCCPDECRSSSARRKIYNLRQ